MNFQDLIAMLAGAGGGGSPMPADLPPGISAETISGMGMNAAPPAQAATLAPPMPRPRPQMPMELSASGGQPRGQAPMEMGAPGGLPMGPMPPMDISPPGGGGGSGGLPDFIKSLMGAGAPTKPGAPVPDDGGALDLLMPSGRARNIRGRLAAGLGSMDKRFGLGAAGSAMGATLGGGMYQDKDEHARRVQALDRVMRMRDQGNIEGSRQEMARYRQAQAETARKRAETAARNAGAGRGAWNKPDAQRFQEAEKLVESFAKRESDALNREPLMGPQREQRRAQLQTKIDEYRRNVYRRMNIPDEPGAAAAPGAPAPAGPAAPAAGGGAPRQVNSAEEFQSLPSGTTFIAPDGTVRKKP